jgi:uncharacterized protein (DUF4415 family)
MSKKHTVRFSLDVDNPPPLTKKQRAVLEALDKLPDSEIDLSDIPEHATFYKPVKRQTTVRIDADILAWLKTYGRGYQTKINAILRQEMLAAKGK